MAARFLACCNLLTPRCADVNGNLTDAAQTASAGKIPITRPVRTAEKRENTGMNRKVPRAGQDAIRVVHGARAAYAESRAKMTTQTDRMVAIHRK